MKEMINILLNEGWIDIINKLHELNDQLNVHLKKPIINKKEF